MIAQLLNFRPSASEVRDAVILPDWRFGITTINREMSLWNLETGKQISTVISDSIGRITLSSDGRYALTFGRDSGVTVWKLPEVVALASAPVATQETRDQFDATIAAVRAAKTDEDWKNILAADAPLTPNRTPLTDPVRRGLLELTAGLPDEMLQALLKEGYLKWKVSDLDEARQQIILDYLTEVFKDDPHPPADPDNVKALLQSSVAGLIVLNRPESETQTVYWQVKLEEPPRGYSFTVSEETAQGERKRLTREQGMAYVRQFRNWERKPYSKLPQTPGEPALQP